MTSVWSRLNTAAREIGALLWRSSVGMHSTCATLVQLRFRTRLKVSLEQWIPVRTSKYKSKRAFDKSISPSVWSASNTVWYQCVSSWKGFMSSITSHKWTGEKCRSNFSPSRILKCGSLFIHQSKPKPSKSKWFIVINITLKESGHCKRNQRNQICGFF